mgnify:CR=1 FL=1
MGLFDNRVTIPTSTEKADRVWKGLKKHLGGSYRRKLFESYLAGRPGVGTAIYHVVRDRIPNPKSAQAAANLESIVQIDTLSRKVRREAHRMKGFIRFEKTGDNRYVALIAPRYDVLPLIRQHFETRFADQEWIIYDTCRSYGLHYNRRNTREIKPGDTRLEEISCHIETLDEKLCQRLWQQYYTAANISPRNNPKLHLSQLPRRYWRYLPEKKTTR